MKKITLLFIILIFSSNSIFSQSNVEEICHGKILKFDSKILNEKKRIFVYLPLDFKNKSYPAIYLITSIPNDFKASICQGEFIVVGIENNEPKKYFLEEKNRDNYLRFLEKELIPFIENDYNSSQIKFITGHSISGGFVMDIFNRSPDSFSFYLATSPVLHMLNMDIGKNAFSKPVYLYFNIGSRENYEQLEKANHDLFQALDSLKIKNLQWKFEVLVDETHETNEFTGFCRGYNYYKSLSTIPDSLISKNIHIIVDYVIDLDKQLGHKVEIGESIFMPNLLINLNTGRYDNVLDALKYIAEVNTDFFVNESQIMTDIADEIYNNGNYEIARQTYQLIYDKTQSEIVLERISDLDKKK